MKKKPTLQWSATICRLAIALTIASTAIAQDEPLEEFDLFDPDAPFLGPVVVTANRYPIPLTDSGSSVTALNGETLETQQIRSLENSLRLVPGVITATTGARGSNTAIFLRGTESDQTQIRVDGIRVSDSNILPSPFLGGENIHNLGSIEVLRGPQSSLYGGESIGGVISLTTRRGEGEPTFSLFGEAGSFNTFSGGFSGQGQVGGLAYSLSAGAESTQNDRANNDFEQYQSSLRLDFQPVEDTTLTFTLRQAYREYGSPGTTASNDPDNLDRDDTILLSSHLETRVNDLWTTHLTFGTLFQEFEFEAPPATTEVDSNRIVADWHNVLEFSEHHTTLFGAGAEHTSIENSGFGNVDETEDLFSLYGQHTIHFTEAFAITGGGRYEDYDSVGDKWTYRGTATYTLDRTGTRLHGSYGSAFKAPSFLDLYGLAPFVFVGNPDLVPEESTGWDIGIEQQLGASHLIDVTWFHNDIENLIDFVFPGGFFAPGTTVNVDEATTEGLEVALRGSFAETINYSLAYTYLLAENETAGTRLLRRPHHTLSFDINAQLCERLLLGFGGHLVNDRKDVGFQLPFGTVEGDNYFTARVYGNYTLSEKVALSFRVENVFDEDYQEVAGFPALPLGAYAGIRIDF